MKRFNGEAVQVFLERRPVHSLFFQACPAEIEAFSGCFVDSLENQRPGQAPRRRITLINELFADDYGEFFAAQLNGKIFFHGFGGFHPESLAVELLCRSADHQVIIDVLKREETDLEKIVCRIDAQNSRGGRLHHRTDIPIREPDFSPPVGRGWLEEFVVGLVEEASGLRLAVLAVLVG